MGRCYVIGRLSAPLLYSLCFFIDVDELGVELVTFALFHPWPDCPDSGTPTAPLCRLEEGALKVGYGGVVRRVVGGRGPEAGQGRLSWGDEDIIWSNSNFFIQFLEVIC